MKARSSKPKAKTKGKAKGARAAEAHPEAARESRVAAELGIEAVRGD
jgi:hypothetical protein